MAVSSLLLGIALTCPAILFLLALFPISPQNQRSHLEDVLFPGIAIALHVLLGPLLEEVVYRGLFLQLARRYWTQLVPRRKELREMLHSMDGESE